MQSQKWTAFVAGLCLLLAAGSASADANVRWGISIGVPWVWHYPPPVRFYPPYQPYPPYPYYYGPSQYPYPYYYDYPTPPVLSAPPQYIEKDAGAQSPANPPGYWYYCRKPDGYYPYVRECPAGWERVAPVPQSGG